MGITLTPGEERELAEQTRRDPEVVSSFYQWYARLKAEADDATACRLALGKQEEVFQAVYADKLALYRQIVRRNYRVRLETLRKLSPRPRFKTRNGLLVRSKVEKIIADFLFALGLRYDYEPIVEVGGFHVMPDFRLLDSGVLVEHFGLDTPAYEQAKAAKLERYQRCGVAVVWTEAADEPQIEDVLVRKLQEVGIHVRQAQFPSG